MAREWTLKKTVEVGFVVVVVLMLYALFMSNKDFPTEPKVQYLKSLTFSSGREETFEEDTICYNSVCAPAHKQGMDIIYQPLISCYKPEFLSDYANPCWKATNKLETIACSAKVMLLGFPKCGTKDMERWFGHHSQVASAEAVYFYETELTATCPNKWLQRYPRGRKYLTTPSKLGYASCQDCAVIGKVMNFSSTYISRQSAIQFLQYTTVEDSRFIVSMRQPSERLFSNFFYTYKRELNIHPYVGYDVAHVGNAFFHKLVSDAVIALTECLKNYGTTECILQPELSPLRAEDTFIARMITIGCYSTHLKELLKFIPKEAIYFSKLEDYARDEAAAMEKIYTFLGLSFSGEDDPSIQKYKNTIYNVGLETKPVLAKTRTLLDEFYEAFNIELAELLEDDRWLWR